MSEVKLELVAFAHGEVQIHPLPASGEIVLGRAQECQVRIEHPSVSRRHVALTLGSELLIRDLGGANGAFVRDRSAPENSIETRTMRRLDTTGAKLQIGEVVSLGEVTLLVRRAAEGPSEFEDLGAPSGATPGLIIQNEAMRSVYGQAERAAKSPISVLILGETGVGKELLARALHARSQRAAAPFMSINCAALSETLLEGELFGYERGAFTGAVEARPGLFEAADRGTVFLDEVGELAATTQAKLLRVLEDRTVLRLGSRRARTIDVRFVAATNRDLEAEANAGRFRTDLYFRLAGLTLTLPPLRERPDEIEPLCSTFLASALRQLDRTEPSRLSKQALSILRAYAWPGNVRELRNVIERAAVLCVEREVGVEHLPPKLVQAVAPRAQASAAPAERTPATSAGGFQQEVKDFERQRLLAVLEECGGNQTRAAEVLGISRRTLVSRLTEFGLTRPRRRPPE